MDDKRFDTFTKHLAQGRTRRSILSMLGGSLVAVVSGRKTVSAYPPPDTCQDKPGGHCTTHIPCCHGFCNDSGTCGCAEPEVECHARCTRLESDAFNCGACGKVCPKGSACCGGECTLVKGDDPNNCGGCGTFCEGVCVEGSCKACVGITEKCREDDDCCNGVCFDGICQCLKKDEVCKDDSDCCTGNCMNGRCGCASFGTPGCYDCCSGECSDVACKGCNKTGGECAIDADCCGPDDDPKKTGICVKGTCLPA